MEKEQLQELIENNKEDIFSEIKDEISDDTVTDIEWDGYNLWITQLGRGCYISMKELSDKYMDNLSIRLANIMGACSGGRCGRRIAGRPYREACGRS